MRKREAIERDAAQLKLGSDGPMLELILEALLDIREGITDLVLLASEPEE